MQSLAAKVIFTAVFFTAVVSASAQSFLDMADASLDALREGREQNAAPANVREIFAKAKTAADDDAKLNLCGFYTGMSAADAKTLVEHYGLKYGEWTIAGDPVFKITFSLKGVRRITKGGNTFNELARAVANRVGSLSGYGSEYSLKTIDGIVVEMTDSNGFVMTDTDIKAAVERRAREAHEAAERRAREARKAAERAERWEKEAEQRLNDEFRNVLRKDAFLGIFTLPDNVTPDFITLKNLEGLRFPVFNESQTTLWSFPRRSPESFVMPDSVTKVTIVANSSLEKMRSPVFNESKTRMWSFPKETPESFVMPDGVTDVTFEARRNLEKMQSPVFNESKTRMWSFPEETPESFVMPDSVTDVTFEANRNLKKVRSPVFNESGTKLLYVPQSTSGQFSIPDGVVTIGREAFSDCMNITQVILPPSVKHLEPDAFNRCVGPSEVFLDNDNRTLCFVPRRATGTFVIPDTVTNILSGAFYGCDRLTKIEFPKNMESASYSRGAFVGCSNLVDVILDSEKRTLVYVPERMASVTIPNSVTNIGWNAFSGCSALTSIAIPDNVTSIGWGAFSGCTALTSVTIPDSVTNIGWHVFFNCPALTSVTIPNSVTNINEIAFVGSNLTSASLPKALEPLNIIFPKGCKVTYR